MGVETAIAWCDHTFNPWWGCQRVSPGCEHCYAESFSKRVGLKVWGATNGRRFFGDKHWMQPHRWNLKAQDERRRHKVFCASMADVFEDRRDLDRWRTKLWAVIEATPWLDWQLLTKRPENMIRLAPERWSGGWPSNVWSGTTCEDQQRADERLGHLRAVPAAVHFVSYEPALDRLRLAPVPGIDWLIVGGESGPRARPFDLGWARDIVEQCDVRDVACFVKQLGDHPVEGALGAEVHLRAPKGGDPAEWPSELRVRQFPESAFPETAS